jgi:nucleolar protein 56
MDKDLNTFSMRIKEWYGWHFPELAKIVTENEVYVKLVLFIDDKASLTEESLPGLEEIVKEGEMAS